AEQESCRGLLPKSRLTYLSASTRGGLFVVHLCQDGHLDFPLDALAGGRLPIDADRAHAARSGVMGHEPGIKLAPAGGGEAEEEIETAVGDGIRAIDALVADDEIAIAGLGTDESALLRQHLEERVHQRAAARVRASTRTPPGAVRGTDRVLIPTWARRMRSASPTGTAGCTPGRSAISPLPTVDHNGEVSSERASMPATAPQGAKVSRRPRSRSRAWTRG